MTWKRKLMQPIAAIAGCVLGVLAVGIGGPEVTHASDFGNSHVYQGSACTPNAQNNDYVSYDVGSVVNSDPSSESWVTCPVVRSSNGGSTDWVDITMESFDGHGTWAVACYLRSSEPDESSIDQWYDSTSGLSHTWTNALAWDVNIGTAQERLWLDCTMPQKEGAYAPSRISMYQVRFY